MPTQLRQFLNLLPSSEDESRFSKDLPLEVRVTHKYFSSVDSLLHMQYSVTEVWSVPYTGVVVNGIINSGRVTAGDPILIGPDSVGNWIVSLC
jgi:GTPase